MQLAIARRTFVRNDIEIVRRDGTVACIQNDVEPLYDTHGDMYGCVSICVDTTDRRLAEQGKMDLHRHRINLAAVLQSALESSRPAIDAQGHAVIVDIPEAPIWAYADFTPRRPERRRVPRSSHRGSHGTSWR
jgi:hypothetical protein